MAKKKSLAEQLVDSGLRNAQQGRVSDAIEDLEAALEVADDDLEADVAAFNLGVVHMLTGGKGKRVAKKYLKRTAKSSSPTIAADSRQALEEIG